MPKSIAALASLRNVPSLITSIQENVELELILPPGSRFFSTPLTMEAKFLDLVDPEPCGS
jgi:hypothetical protein